MLSQKYVRYPEKKYTDLRECYENHLKSFWVHWEIEYSRDKNEWLTLDDDTKFFIKRILAFFAGADGIVQENLMINFMQDIMALNINEAKSFYAIQGLIEEIHAEVYATLLDTYVTDFKEKEYLFNSMDTIPCIKKKAEWALKWMNRDTNSLSERLIAFIIIEGVFFCGAFCAIYWLKDNKKMSHSLGVSNEFISRDESLHCDFGVKLYKYLPRLDEKIVHKIFKEGVNIEKEFIIDSIPCSLIGMNSKNMIEYIKNIADMWLVRLGYNKLYNAKQPFNFMNKIKLDNKSNFFEKRVTDYGKFVNFNKLEYLENF